MKILIIEDDKHILSFLTRGFEEDGYIVDSEQMEQRVTQLLLLTKYTKENIHLSFEPCSLDAILIATIDKFETAL